MSRRYPDHDYNGRTIWRSEPRHQDRRQQSSGRHEHAKPPAARALPPALAPLAALATPAEIDTAYQGQCPRGRSHALHILHVGGRWRLFCTKGCSEGDILKTIGRPPDVLRYRPPAEPRPPKERSFEYLSRDGERLFGVVRKLDVPSDRPGKDRFHIRLLPDGRRLKPGNGGYPDWVKGLLYCRAELRASTDECEGEKDAEALRDLGLVAVTTSCGAHGFNPGKLDIRDFRERRIVLVPDNDGAGRMYADRVAGWLAKAGVKIAVITLPRLRPKGDVSDWLMNGGSVGDLLQAARVPDFFKPAKGAPPLPKADPTKVPLGTVEAAIVTALAQAAHRSLTTDALPMLVAGLPGEEAWNASAKEPIVRYRDVPKAELAKVRAGISRALGSLARRGLVEKTGRWARLARSAPSRRP
ncbi:MAG TPA: toprim domain-containing protein [Hyphomicrobiaceae bacterium]